MLFSRTALFSIVVINFFCIVGVVSKLRKIGRVYNIEMCEKTPKALLTVNEFRIFNPKKASTVFYLNATVLEDFTSEPQLEIKLMKCMVRENPDTCEILTKLQPSQPCFFMFMKNMMWTNFVENIEPPIACYAKKGEYILKNATVDPELFNVFPINGYNWKFELKFWLKAVKSEYITICVDAEVLNVNI